ncbi:response regulator [Marinobacter litoralis]|uniref:response regulator n=1 Tax=Marinobacter litoralis TaxID=187981 RepID=UPI0018EAFAF0|nr:response regulator [Marinobacter litoralis]MBJ6136579.1 response regulator [Marinobacter litoralis]
MKHPSEVRIFIADDDPDDLLLIQDAFEESGDSLLLTLFDKGDALLAALKEAAHAQMLPQLIILDLNMPGTNGRDVIRDLKADPAICHIPVIILTTSSSEQDIVKCFELGASSYIVKPARYSELLQVARSLKDYWTETTELPGTKK